MSLAGQTVGRAVVLDFSRHMHRLIGINPVARTARVQPGLVQDDLNKAAAAHGLFFAPDTSTSNRATLGGMITIAVTAAVNWRYDRDFAKDFAESFHADGGPMGEVRLQELREQAQK